jgi:hypothetical protein
MLRPALSLELVVLFFYLLHHSYLRVFNVTSPFSVTLSLRLVSLIDWCRFFKVAVAGAMK